MSTKKFTSLVIVAFFFAAVPLIAQNITTPRTPSPAGEVSQTIGISKVIINYSRPAVREREIWGTQLAHYGYVNLGFGSATAAPWRAGANENTTITFTNDAIVEGKSIPAGTYGLFLGLYEDGKADVIFSKNAESWGSYFYSQDEDQLRVSITSIENAHTERLTYSFIDIDKTSVTAVLDWEKKRFPFKITFDVDNIVLANADNELRNFTGFFWQGPSSAAQYSLSNNVELEKGLAWAEQSIAIQKNFNNLNLKAQILSKLGKAEDSKKIMDEALALSSATITDYYQYGRQLIGRDMDKEAMDLFTIMNKKWPDHWLAPHGLARGYSANGDYKKALKYEKIALSKCPEGSKGFLEGYVTKLEKGEDFN
jgi:tetratricopeptide (TPR) repeat protein